MDEKQLDDFVKEVKRGKWSDVIRSIPVILIGALLVSISTELALWLNQPWIGVGGLWLGWLGITVGASHLLRRLLFPYIDLRRVADRAMGDPVGAGLVFLGVSFVIGMLIFSGKAQAATEPYIPAGAVKYLPVISQETRRIFPELELKYVAGQIHQESCITPKHAKCFTPYAELNTWRERGVGFGQVTMKKDGSMDVLAELRGRHYRELGAWSWGATLYDPVLQTRGLLLLNKDNYIRVAVGAATHEDALAMMFIAYNGGAGRVISDRKLCASTRGCDSTRWFGHAEKTSKLPKKAVAGYGKSFFEINREYPHNIMGNHANRYVAYINAHPELFGGL